MFGSLQLNERLKGLPQANQDLYDNIHNHMERIISIIKSWEAEFQEVQQYEGFFFVSVQPLHCVLPNTMSLSHIPCSKLHPPSTHLPSIPHTFDIHCLLYFYLVCFSLSKYRKPIQFFVKPHIKHNLQVKKDLGRIFLFSPFVKKRRNKAVIQALLTSDLVILHEHFR